MLKQRNIVGHPFYFSGPDEYAPQRLQNWEVPKWYPDRPLPASQPTVIVANDRGHLLPGIPRSSESPWGNFIPTWDLPTKITRELADKLSAPNPVQVQGFKNRLQRYEVRKSARAKKVKFASGFPAFGTGKQPPVPKGALFCVCCGKCPCANHLANSENVESVEKPKSESGDKRDEESDDEEEKSKNGVSQEMNEAKIYVEASKNFELARELHKVNLEHDPLPDTIADRAFRRMQIQQPHRHPGLALPSDNFAAAVGYKTYNNHPHRCSKLNIFRPKTSSSVDSDNDSLLFEKKWRFLRRNKVTPIELAICWDMRPIDPADEPKPSKHVDGSNGSAAPAVFTTVQSPKNLEANDRNEPTSGRNPPAIFHNIDETPVFRPRTTVARPMRDHEEIKRARSAHDEKCLVHRSVPDVSASQTGSACECFARNLPTRLCVACELRACPSKTRRPRAEFKMAFKAGVPNNTRSLSASSASTSDGAAAARFTLKVPKMKNPYAKTNYTIDSLSGPFALKKDKREDYPDNSRLASVYQHSYKPVHLRKKSLLRSVYQ